MLHNFELTFSFHEKVLDSLHEIGDCLRSVIIDSSGAEILGQFQISGVSSIDVQANNENYAKKQKLQSKSFQSPSKGVKKTCFVQNKATSSQCTNDVPVGFKPEKEVSKVDVSSLVTTLVNASTNEKLFQCSFCSYQTKTGSHAKRHVELKHVPNNSKFSCVSCPKQFNLKSNLKTHYIRTHKMPEAAATAILNS